jgi:hypothetical protein
MHPRVRKKITAANEQPVVVPPKTDSSTVIRIDSLAESSPKGRLKKFSIQAIILNRTIFPTRKLHKSATYRAIFSAECATGYHYFGRFTEPAADRAWHRLKRRYRLSVYDLHKNHII